MDWLIREEHATAAAVVADDKKARIFVASMAEAGSEEMIRGNVKNHVRWAGGRNSGMSADRTTNSTSRLWNKLGPWQRSVVRRRLTTFSWCYGLDQAAVIASAKNRRFMAYFTRKLTGREREKGITTKMRIKLAAKMLVIAWTLMKKREVFDPGCIEE